MTSLRYTVRYTPFGAFDDLYHSMQFPTPSEWNQRQLVWLEKKMSKSNDVLSFTDHVKLFSAATEQPYSFVCRGNLHWNAPWDHLNRFGARQSGRRSKIPIEYNRKLVTGSASTILFGFVMINKKCLSTVDKHSFYLIGFGKKDGQHLLPQ